MNLRLVETMAFSSGVLPTQVRDQALTPGYRTGRVDQFERRDAPTASRRAVLDLAGAARTESDLARPPASFRSTSVPAECTQTEGIS